MSFEEDGPLAFAGATPASGNNTAPEDVSGIGKAAVLLLFGAAGSYVLYKTVVNRPAADATTEKQAAAAAAAEGAAASSEIKAKLADAKSQRRARVHALRHQKIHLHQFEYAWAAQAHLRMANANFDEHNVRHPNATPEMSFPVLVCGQHVVPSASLLRVLEDAFPLAAGVKVSDGADADAGRRRLSLLSREVDTAESLFHFKLWNEHSTVRKWNEQRLMAAVPLRPWHKRWFTSDKQKAFAPSRTSGGASFDFTGGEIECVSRLRQSLTLLSEELTSGGGVYFGGKQPSAVDARVFGLMMQMEECDPFLFAKLFGSPASGSTKLRNLDELQKRIFKRFFEPTAGDQAFKPTFTSNFFLSAPEWNVRRPVIFCRSRTTKQQEGQGGAAKSDEQDEPAFQDVHDDDGDDDADEGAYSSVPPPKPKSVAELEREAQQWRETKMWLVGVGVVTASFLTYGQLRQMMHRS